MLVVRIIWVKKIVENVLITSFFPRIRTCVPVFSVPVKRRACAGRSFCQFFWSAGSNWLPVFNMQPLSILDSQPDNCIIQNNIKNAKIILSVSFSHIYDWTVLYETWYTGKTFFYLYTSYLNISLQIYSSIPIDWPYKPNPTSTYYKII